MFNYSSSVLLRQYYQEGTNIPFHLRFILIPGSISNNDNHIDDRICNYVFLYPQIYYYVLYTII